MLPPGSEREIAVRPMMRAHHLRTVLVMAHNGYLERLRRIPAFRHCTRRQLEQVVRLVDDVQLPPGTQLRGESGELIVTLVPTRALVVDRRARSSVLDVAPALAPRPPEVPLHPA